MRPHKAPKTPKPRISISFVIRQSKTCFANVLLALQKNTERPKNLKPKIIFIIQTVDPEDEKSHDLLYKEQSNDTIVKLYNTINIPRNQLERKEKRKEKN